MTLEDWLKNKWIKPHETSPREIADLFEIVDRDLHDAAIRSISPDWRLNIAFNAALQCGIIALHASGYRASGEGHHERVVNSLKFTIGASDTIIRQLNRLRQKRVTNTYDAAGSVSEQEVAEAIDFAKNLRKSVEEWIREHYPDLL